MIFNINKIISLVSLSIICATSCANMNTILPNGQTLLMNKIEDLSTNLTESGTELVSEMIMDQDFNPFIKDNRGWTAGDYAKFYKLRNIEYLIIKKEYEQYSLENSKKPMMQVFLHKGEEKKELIRAISLGSYNAVKEFLDKNKKFNLNYTIDGKIAPLFATALIKDVNLAAKMFDLLVNRGANPNLVLDAYGGDSLGHVFCSSDNYLMLFMAISKGYDLSIKNRNNLDVYGFSIRNNHEYCRIHLENILREKNEKILQ